VLDPDVADEKDDHPDEGKAEQDEGREDEQRHGPHLRQGWWYTDGPPWLVGVSGCLPLPAHLAHHNRGGKGVSAALEVTVGGEGGGGTDLAGGGMGQFDEVGEGSLRAGGRGAGAVDGVEAPGGVRRVHGVGKDAGQLREGQRPQGHVIIVAVARGAGAQNELVGGEMGGVGLVGGEVADLVGAGVSGVAEVNGPVVARPGAFGVLQDEASVLTTSLGEEQGEVIGGHGAVSFTTFAISCQ